MKNYSDDEALAAQAVLKPLLEVQAANTGFELSALGHAYIDLAWLWPIRETIRKGARTFSTVLYQMERYPDYKFGASQAQLYSWMKDRYGELFRKIQKKVAEGKWEIQGGMWIESDLNVVGGEALVRQFLYGQRFFQQHFGRRAEICWLPDTFGFNGSLPQLIRSAGMTRFVTQKIRTAPHQIQYPQDTFWWEGIVGSKVLTHVAPFENYGSSASPVEVKQTEARFRDKLTCPSALLLFGQGDGGGAGAECLEALQRQRSLEGLSPVTQRLAGEFFDRIEPYQDLYQVWKGSMDLDMHTGTLTSSAESKRLNRLAENKLHMLEWLMTMTDSGCSKARLDTIWQEVLLYQFHDIITGTSIARVYEESLPAYRRILNELDDYIEQAGQVIATALFGERQTAVLTLPLLTLVSG